MHGGTHYTNAKTPVPSDSFPGLLAQVTGGDPKVTGVYYDVSYDHSLLPAGTTTCPANATLGASVNYDESLDLNPAALDAGQGLAGLPGSILAMTGQPRTLLDPAKLPVDPRTCKPVYPHQFLRVNTIFEVARQHGLRTAWSDKHPSYEILNGPSGKGVQDLFTPDINSDAPGGGDWTTDNAATMTYDNFKVQSVLNEIDGFDHSGTRHVGVPALFGLNLQTVSTAEKLPVSQGLTGGYLPGTTTPGPLLTRALDYVNTQVGALSTELWAQGIGDSTTIILSAKHGQSPVDPSLLTRIDDGPLLDGLNAAWKATHPSAPDLVGSATDDDAMIVWLTDHSKAATDFAKTYLLAQSGVGNDINGNPKPFTASGLATVYAGQVGRRLLRHRARRPAHARPVRGRAARRRVHRQEGQDRRTRRRARRRSRCADRRLRPTRRAPEDGDERGRDHADRADDPEAARTRPRQPAGRADRAHGDAAACLIAPDADRRAGTPTRSSSRPFCSYSGLASAGDLSGRRPRHDGCRSRRSWVHSENTTSPTSSGLTHTACRACTFGTSATAGVLTANGFNWRRRSASVASEKPVPT